MAWHNVFTQFLANNKDHTKASFWNSVFLQALDNDNYLKENKLDTDRVVNTTTETIAGKALDAIQANPIITGSLAAQIADLREKQVILFNGSISTGTITLSESILNFNELYVISGAAQQAQAERVAPFTYPSKYTISSYVGCKCFNGNIALQITDATTLTIVTANDPVRRIIGVVKEGVYYNASSNPRL